MSLPTSTFSAPFPSSGFLSNYCYRGDFSASPMSPTSRCALHKGTYVVSEFTAKWPVSRTLRGTQQFKKQTLDK